MTDLMMMLASHMLIFKFSSEKLNIKGLLLALSIYLWLSALRMSSIEGVITNYFNVNNTSFIVTIIAEIGFVLSLVLNDDGTYYLK